MTTHSESILVKFKFLTVEKGFSEAEIKSGGDSYQKVILFKKKRLLIEITNSWDMGFAIRLKTKGKSSDKGILVYSRSVREMDSEFKYLDDGVNKVKSLIG